MVTPNEVRDLRKDCHPVYNHGGSVNCFFATRRRGSGKDGFAVAFPLLEQD